MADFIYRRGRRKLLEELQNAVSEAQAARSAELAMHPDTLAQISKDHAVPDGARVSEYHGYKLIESAAVPVGQVFVVPKGTGRIEPEYEDIYEHGSDKPVDRVQTSADQDFTFTLESFDASSKLERLGASARETGEAMHDLAGMFSAALEVSSRMLPPPEWQDRAVRAAQAAGMDLEWCQSVSNQAGKTDTWAHVRTRRGGFDVRPEQGESWTQALAAVGLDVPLA